MNYNLLAREEVGRLVEAAAVKAAADGALPAAENIAYIVEIPRETAHGDWSTNYALAAAKPMRMSPRKIADALTARIDLTDTYFASVEVAGAGFLNFRLGPKWFASVPKTILTEGAEFAKSKAAHPEKIMVEFVSANPTGPMHMGNARGGVLGDCLSEILTYTGHDVLR